MSLERVTYTSSAAGDPTDADFESLLLSARRRNEEHEVTGVLLYHDGSFFQYFEGPDVGVQEVYGHIRRSTLHRGLIELERSAARERQFPRWLMGFTHAPRSTMLKLSNASWQATVSDVDGSPCNSYGMEMLLSFWKTNRRGRR